MYIRKKIRSVFKITMINIFRKLEKEEKERLKDGKFPQIIVIHKKKSSPGNYSFWEEVTGYFDSRLHMAKGKFKGQEERSKSHFKTGTQRERRVKSSEKTIHTMCHKVKTMECMSRRWGTKDFWRSMIDIINNLTCSFLQENKKTNMEHHV